MATIRNEVTVNASIERVWTILTDLELLDKYDPTVKKSTLVSSERTGLGAKIKVKQVMEYTVKFGLLGRLLDAIMIRKQSDTGIKKFFAGLKSYAETK